jgi:hypothetical protein
VNHAFSLGVLIVVAGESEDKDIVAARVSWTGAGINLKTRNAGAEQIRNAVRTILTKNQYRDEAQRLRTSFSHYDALNELARAVDGVLGQNTIKARPCAEPNSSFYPAGRIDHYIEPHPKRNYSLNCNLNVEQQFSTHFSSTVRYVGSHSIHLPFQADEMNQVAPSQVQIITAKRKPRVSLGDAPTTSWPTSLKLY